MHRTLVFSFLLLAATDAAANRVVDADKTRVSISCTEDPVVTITSNRSDVTITGACRVIDIAGNANHVTIASTAALSIEGNHNTAAVELVDGISVPGNDNTVTYRGAVGPKSATKVSSLGSRNKVKKLE